MSIDKNIDFSIDTIPEHLNRELYIISNKRTNWISQVWKLANNLTYFRVQITSKEIQNFKLKANINKRATRAGALAGVGLALDPEGKKSVLIQPSSHSNWKKYFQRPLLWIKGL